MIKDAERNTINFNAVPRSVSNGLHQTQKQVCVAKTTVTEVEFFNIFVY